MISAIFVQPIFLISQTIAFFRLSLLINSSKAFEKKKKGQLSKNLKLSPWVTPTGLKPITLPAAARALRDGRQASDP